LREYPVKLLCEMLETYSPSGCEKALASLLNDDLCSFGFNSSIDQTGNLVAEAGDEGPEIVFCGHMDTVPGEIPVRLENDFIYGRGAVDAKSSLAAMMVAASRIINDPKNSVRVKLVGVVREETSSEGFQNFFSTTTPPDLIVFGEPSQLTNIIIGYKGRINLNVECTTDGGHSASPWISRNSVEEAYSFWKTLQTSIVDNEAESKFNSITGSLTGLSSSGPENSIPKQAILNIDIRLPPRQDPSDVLERIEKLAQSYIASRSRIKLSVLAKERTRAYVADTDSRLVSAYRRAIRTVTGTAPALLKKTGSSDMNLLPSNIPAIAYGPGDSKLDHTENERISIREYLNSIEVHSHALRLFSQQTVLDKPALTIPS
jgi:[amino group carrier protein]-lysine/ornithine hydrolase